MPSRIYDLTPRIDSELKVWPGDTPPTREVLLDMAQGANITLSTLRATVHLGAHADAPNHYGTDAAAIESRSLDFYLGLCQVIHTPIPRKSRLRPEQVQAKVTAPRVLFATNTFPDPWEWNTDFGAFSPELIEWLHTRGVRLVGIDTPSVDLSDSKDLPTHQAILRHDMAILEGLVMKDVPEGLYELIALPLPLVGFDASPVRAILRTLPS